MLIDKVVYKAEGRQLPYEVSPSPAVFTGTCF